jgi:hypothetical protein
MGVVTPKILGNLQAAVDHYLTPAEAATAHARLRLKFDGRECDEVAEVLLVLLDRKAKVTIQNFG